MANLPKVIGLAGTNGSGKDTVGELLGTEFGYLFVSVTEILRNELKRRGLSVTRENLRDLSAEWRRENNNLGVLVDKAMAELEASSREYAGLAVASLRNPGEISTVHKLGGVVIWLDADPRLRYERVTANSTSRDRGGEDNVSFSEFLAQEDAEMNPRQAGDNAVLNMAAVKLGSDIFLDNSVDKQTLSASLKEVLLSR
jgi:dephospho-CoA kinase